LAAKVKHLSAALILLLDPHFVISDLLAPATQPLKVAQKFVGFSMLLIRPARSAIPHINGAVYSRLLMADRSLFSVAFLSRPADLSRPQIQPAIRLVTFELT